MVKVLIVEDEPGVRNVLMNTFESVGYKTFGAASAQEAMDIFLKEKPDAIFLDILLPDKSGLDLLKEIKQINKDAVVIMVSSWLDEDTMNKAKLLGAAECISKPFFRETLRSALTRHLSLFHKKPLPVKPRILIVDDEEDICLSLNKYLKNRVEIDSVITFDGNQACDLILKNNFDVVFMDIKLPGKDGLTIIQETKPKTPDTTFLVLTGYLGQEFLQRAKFLGVTEYFHKPVDLENIYKKIQSILIAKNKYIPRE